jgi:putative transposase
MAQNYHAELFYHYIWRTKDRRPLIVSELEARIWASIKNRCVQLDAIPIEVGGMPDHVHLLISAPPTLTPATFIGQLKGGNSHFINESLRPAFHFRYGEGYGVLTVAKRNVPAVQRYIQNQKEHHAKETTNATMERCEPEEPEEPDGKA